MKYKYKRRKDQGMSVINLCRRYGKKYRIDWEKVELSKNIQS